MKKIVIKSILAISCFSLCLISCGKEEIPYFDSQYNAVRFNSTNEYDAETDIFKGNYSFLENPFDEYGEYELPLVLVGNVSTEDRTVNYVINAEETTAPENSYEITAAVIPANSLKGTIKIRLFNTDEIQNGASYKLYIQLKESSTLGLGPKEYITATVSWNNNIIAPPATERYVWMTYNSLIKSSLAPTSYSTTAYSSNALKTIVTALDWDDWDDMTAHPDQPQRPTYFTYKYLANYRLFVTDKSYEAYAAKLADYLKKYQTKEESCKAMLKNQIAKCTTSGFITGFGGIITMPVTLPANVGSVMYVQMRMIACVAYMAGYELNSDQTQTFVYACLAGVAVNELIKQAGIKFGVKFANGLIKKIPGKVLTKINQKVGFRFITKFGTKGIVNLGKMLPGVGAVIGGGLDLVETKVIADRAYKWFFMGDFSEASKEDNIIDIEDADFDEIIPEEKHES